MTQPKPLTVARVRVRKVGHRAWLVICRCGQPWQVDTHASAMFAADLFTTQCPELRRKR